MGGRTLPLAAMLVVFVLSPQVRSGDGIDVKEFPRQDEFFSNFVDDIVDDSDIDRSSHRTCHFLDP